MKPCSSTAAILAILLTSTLSAASANAEEARAFPIAGQGESGALGVGRLTRARPGEPGVVRVGLRGGFFQSGSFPGAGADHRLLAGQLAASWTALPMLEVFGAYRFSSNSNSLESPSIVQAQGDILLGAKVGITVDKFDVGADLRFDLRNGIGSDLPALDGSTIQIRALGSHTLPVADRPLALHVNMGAAIGRSDAALDERMTPGLLFGTGFSGYHRFLMGVGARYDMGFVSPFATLDLDLPLGIEDDALADADTSTLGAATKRITLGAELQTTASSALQLAAEIGFGSGVAGFAPTQPWMLTAAWSFAFDASLYGTQAPAATLAAAPAPTTGYVGGQIINAETSEPVAGALVRAAAAGPPVATDVDGRFVTYELEGGPVTLSIEKDGFVSATVDAQVAAGEMVVAGAALKKSTAPQPAMLEGFVAGQLTSTRAEVSARILIEGETSTELTTGNGRFTARLAPGTYGVTILPDAHLAWSGQVVVEAGQAVPLVVALAPAPAQPAFTQKGPRLEPVQGIVLDEQTTAVDPNATVLLREIVDWLVRHPAQSILVGVHADPAPKGTDDRKAWTQRRAEAIRSALIALGAPANRLHATGFGLEQPLVATRVSNKAPNRRVEFVVSVIKDATAPVVESLEEPLELPLIDEFSADMPLPMLPLEDD